MKRAPQVILDRKMVNALGQKACALRKLQDGEALWAWLVKRHDLPDELSEALWDGSYKHLTKYKYGLR